LTLLARFNGDRRRARIYGLPLGFTQEGTMSGRQRCALLVTCLAIAAGFEGTRVVAVQGASCFANPPAGAVQGVDNGSSCSFLGVPYVAAPTGSQRWRPPQALAPWTGVRDATVPPTNCSTIKFLASTLAHDAQAKASL
jgi:hypothetical protein